MFSTDEYNTLHDLVFRSDYSGYKPAIKEIPNGDGKEDSDKRYAHVAPKYLLTQEQRNVLWPYMHRGFAQSLLIAELIGVPEQFLPKIEYGALRVLDYPPGAVSNKHYDFDLFTVMMYRDQPDRFLVHDAGSPSEAVALGRTVNPQLHLGELGQQLGLGNATLHEVLPSETRQHSVVYFAIPDHHSKLPDGLTIRDWLNERMERSRTSFKPY